MYLGTPTGPQEDRRQATHTGTGRCTELATGRASRQEQRPEARVGGCLLSSRPSGGALRGKGHGLSLGEEQGTGGPMRGGNAGEVCLEPTPRRWEAEPGWAVQNGQVTSQAPNEQGLKKVPE